MLGEIRSDLKHTMSWQEQHEERDQARFDALSMQLANLSPTVIRIDKIEGRIDGIEPVIENVKRAKWIATGVAAGLAVVGGMIGSLSDRILKLLT